MQYERVNQPKWKKLYALSFASLLGPEAAALHPYMLPHFPSVIKCLEMSLRSLHYQDSKIFPVDILLQLRDDIDIADADDAEGRRKFQVSVNSRVIY